MTLGATGGPGLAEAQATLDHLETSGATGRENPTEAKCPLSTKQTSTELGRCWPLNGGSRAKSHSMLSPWRSADLQRCRVLPQSFSQRELRKGPVVT